MKSVNQPKLITFVVTNFVLMGIALVGHERVVSLLRSGVNGDWALLGRMAGLPAVGTLAVGLLGWLIPREWKEVLVFWRYGPDRLPSSEAFSKIGPKDPRVDMKQLSVRLGPLPFESAAQNTLWYSIYRNHSNEEAVNDANSAYLLYRDMATLMPILVVASMFIGPAVGAGIVKTGILVLGLCVEFLLIIIADRNAGRRLVVNVLAIEAARPSISTNTFGALTVEPAKRIRKKKETAN